jgi:regulator of protease activity HflC (stomatin/prohibitin superfamily)
MALKRRQESRLDFDLFALWLDQQKQTLSKILQNQSMRYSGKPFAIIVNYREAYQAYRDNNSSTIVVIKDFGKFLSAVDDNGTAVFPIDTRIL